jgi:riboflavin-specific deaminase-like protein
VSAELTPVPSEAENVRYLRSKQGRSRPDVPSDQGWPELITGRVPAGGELADRYGPLVEAGSPLVIAQLGQSLDGFIAARTGDACFVTGDADRTHLHRLRALVDAVVVGVGTVIADDCRLTVRAVSGRNPVRVVLDPRARAPRDAKLLTDSAAPTLWVVADDHPEPEDVPSHVETVSLPRVGPERVFAPRDVLRVLTARGLGRVMVEGGGVTVSRFFVARALDRLLVTTAPLLVGDGVPGLRFEGHARLADALRAPSRRFVLGDDICVELDLRRASAYRAAEPATHEYDESVKHRHG